MADQQTTQITGEVIVNSGVETFGANGFRKCTVVIDTGGDYPQQIPVEFVKDKADKAASDLAVGAMATIDYNLRGREYNGRHYPSVQGWRWKVSGHQAQQEQDDLPMGGDDDNVGF